MLIVAECIEIVLGDDGKYQVGVCDQPACDPGSMQPADSLEQAMQMAQAYFSQEGQEGAEGGNPGEEAGELQQAAGAAGAPPGQPPGQPAGQPGQPGQPGSPNAKALWDDEARRANGQPPAMGV